MVDADTLNLDNFSSCYKKNDEQFQLTDCHNRTQQFNVIDNEKLSASGSSCYDSEGKIITCPFDKTSNNTSFSYSSYNTTSVLGPNGEETKLGHNFFYFNEDEGMFYIVNLDDYKHDALSGLAYNIVEFIRNILMPVFWIGLGGFLVIKGSILGSQIVKAADEPQLRQEKISSLKYLFIGILVAAVIGGAAEVIISVVLNNFG